MAVDTMASMVFLFANIRIFYSRLVLRYLVPIGFANDAVRATTARLTASIYVIPKR